MWTPATTRSRPSPACGPPSSGLPYGEYDDHVISTVRGIGMEPIQWDVDSLDWKDL